MELLTYLDQNKKNCIYVHKSVSRDKIIALIDHEKYFPLFIDNDVIFKRTRFYQIEVDIFLSEREVKKLCKLIFLNLQIPVFFNVYRYYDTHIEVGCIYFNSERKKESYHKFGVVDVQCDIYFPKRNVISINPIYPQFGPFSLSLPTSFEKYTEYLESHSIDTFKSLKVPKELRKEFDRKLLIATYIYNPKVIWGSIEVPSKLRDNITDKLPIERKFNAFDSYISKNEYTKKETNIPNITNIFVSKKDITHNIKKFQTRYPHLTKESMGDMLRFLTDVYYMKDDESFQMHELKEFSSLITDFTKINTLDIITRKNKILLQYRLK
jgi:hypothetical protein